MKIVKIVETEVKMGCATLLLHTRVFVLLKITNQSGTVILLFHILNLAYHQTKGVETMKGTMILKIKSRTEVRKVVNGKVIIWRRTVKTKG